MKKILIPLLLILIAIPLFLFLKNQNKKIISPLGNRIFEKPLDKYAFENLKKRDFKPSKITLGKILKETPNFTSYMFYYNVDLNGKGSIKKVSGLLNLPKREGLPAGRQGTYPVIAMFRGFVPKEIYSPGEGTRRTAEFFAENGFITLAPDFLGYGESDKGSNSSIEDRFQTYVVAATLLSSINNLNSALENTDIKADTEKVGIWGHSNGGHIALSTLEITGKNYPTVLWAPVTKPFPYSILYFTDEFDDNGKALRKVVADFEKDYDVEKYSPINYFEWINAPIQLHQGTDDEAVPLRWSDQFYNKLKKLEKDISYFTYPGENHNFTNGTWPTAIGRSISFYRNAFD